MESPLRHQLQRQQRLRYQIPRQSLTSRQHCRSPHTTPKVTPPPLYLIPSLSPSPKIVNLLTPSQQRKIPLPQIPQLPRSHHQRRRRKFPFSLPPPKSNQKQKKWSSLPYNSACRATAITKFLVDGEVPARDAVPCEEDNPPFFVPVGVVV